MSHSLYMFADDMSPEYKWDPLDEFSFGMTWRTRVINKIIDITVEIIEEVDLVDAITGKTIIESNIDIDVNFTESIDIVDRITGKTIVLSEVDINMLFDEMVDLYTRDKKY